MRLEQIGTSLAELQGRWLGVHLGRARSGRLLAVLASVLAVACGVPVASAPAAGARAATEGWVSQHPPQQSHRLTSVHFLDTSTGWAVGDAGTILKTTNGGINWIRQSCPAGTTALESVYFANANTGWAVGYGIILKTTNGGTTWKVQRRVSGEWLMSVCFTNANTGWVVGSAESKGPVVLKTTNGGTTWKTQYPDTEGLESVHFIDANTGWAVGADYENEGAYDISKTTDGGASWKVQTSGSGFELYDVFFIDATTGWAVGTIGTILKTTDGGGNWVAQPSSTRVGLASVHFLDANIGWAAGSGTMLITTDGGSNWTTQATPTSESLWSVFFIDGISGWAVGGYWDPDDPGAGVILRFHPASAPSTIMRLTPSAGPAGWNNTGVSVSLETTPAPGGPAVERTDVALDSEPWQQYVGVFEVTDEGTHTVRYVSVDASGSVETTKVSSIRIDRTDPTSTVSGIPALPSGRVTFRLSGTDALSGISALRYAINGGLVRTYTTPVSVSSAGTTTLEYWAVDLAGNAEDANTVTFTVTPPVRTAPRVSNPVAPSTMRCAEYYTVHATLKPRHKAGTYPVRIYKYRRVSGRWKAYGYWPARSRGYGAYSSCEARVRLLLRGRWRLRAYSLGDSLHTARWSVGYDYVTVR